jgi:hypothetical protein
VGDHDTDPAASHGPFATLPLERPAVSRCGIEEPKAQCSWLLHAVPPAPGASRPRSSQFKDTL